jgi:hypothetical protein
MQRQVADLADLARLPRVVVYNFKHFLARDIRVRILALLNFLFFFGWGKGIPAGSA